ncbi:MAG: hypothetical protein NTV10_06165 [Methanoregula sp.]|nr:hypothetical protein [Methanoregula sp.]
MDEIDLYAPALVGKKLYRSAVIAPPISPHMAKMIGNMTIERMLNTSTPGRPFANPIPPPMIANTIPQISPTTIPKMALIFAKDITSTLLISCIFSPLVSFQ